MEDTHWATLFAAGAILYVCLNPCFNGRYSLSYMLQVMNGFIVEVLILVLMEDTHWALPADVRPSTPYTRLNPCFNGRYSLSHLIYNQNGKETSCLNPCFNGRYSLSVKSCGKVQKLYVLILVLMEDTHWDRALVSPTTLSIVLILVLMEDTHWGREGVLPERLHLS